MGLSVPLPVRIVVSEVAPSSHTTHEVALVVVQNPKTQRRLTRVMRAMGLEVIACVSTELAQERLRHQRVDLIIFDSTGPGTQRSAAAQQCMSQAPTMLLFDSPEALAANAAFALASPFSLGAIAGHWDDSDLLQVSRRLLARDTFGLEKYLHWGSAIHAYRINHSGQRQALLERLETYVDQLHCTMRTAMRTITAADEYLMNALYDAPTDAVGAHPYANLPRTHTIELPVDKPILFEFGSDGENLVIGCRDLYGSLAPDKVITSLARCLRGGSDQIQQGPGGAGLGLYLAYEHMDHVAINVDPHRSTEVVGIVGLDSHPKDPTSKALHVFVATPQASGAQRAPQQISDRGTKNSCD